MIISPSRNFIFIHLEKCGGTSVESALQPHLEWSDIIMGSTDFGERNQQNYYDRFGRQEVNKFMLWKHSTAKDIHAFLGHNLWSEFNKISVVRDPEELVKSLYFFSQTSIKYHVGRINRSIWKERIRLNDFPEAYPYTEGYIHAYAQSEIDGSGIDGFVSLVLGGDYGFIAPQVHRLEIDKDLSLGFIVELTQLDNKWNEITSLIGIEENVPLEKLNSSERYDLDLSPRSKKMIKKHFAIDYQILPRYTGISW